MERVVSDEIQRSLGRIEGTQTEQLKAQTKIFLMLESLGKDFLEHKGEDRQNHQVISSRIGTLENTITKHDEDEAEYKEARDRSIALVKSDLETLNNYVQNIKGAWWFIGILITIAGGLGAGILWSVQLWQSKTH